MLHGGEIYRIAREKGIEAGRLLDFSANINPLGMPEGMREAFLRGFGKARHYPDAQCGRLTEALAGKEAAGVEEILCGNGAADLIYRIVYGLKPRSALLLEPAFLEYREALKQGDCEIREYRLGPDFQVTGRALEDILECVREGPDLIFLCNPNNPTGLLTDRGYIRRILELARESGTTVVADECFLDFVKNGLEYSAAPYIHEFDNLIVLRSFTKMFALPGVRLGYLLCGNRETVGKIRRAGQTWSVNCIAQEAGLFALTQDAFVERTVAYVAKEAAYLKGQLADCSFRVYDGQANYVFFQAPGREDLYEVLLRENIIIRRCGNYKGLDASYYRVAVRENRDNERLAGALRRAAGKAG